MENQMAISATAAKQRLLRTTDHTDERQQSHRQSEIATPAKAGRLRGRHCPYAKSLRGIQTTPSVSVTC